MSPAATAADLLRTVEATVGGPTLTRGSRAVVLALLLVVTLTGCGCKNGKLVVTQVGGTTNTMCVKHK